MTRSVSPHAVTDTVHTPLTRWYPLLCVGSRDPFVCVAAYPKTPPRGRSGLCRPLVTGDLQPRGEIITGRGLCEGQGFSKDPLSIAFGISSSTQWCVFAPASRQKK